METKKRKNLIRLVSGLLFLALLVGFVLRAGHVLPPERSDYGATWNMYLQEPEDSIDVLFFGSSLVYCDVVPAVIYEETGLTGYVMAGPEQTLSLSYYYIREALKTQSPSVIFLELTGAMFERYQDFTVANVSYMPLLSENRIGAALNAAEPEERFGLLFPLYDYHDQWRNLRRFFSGRPDEILDPLAGYTLMETAEIQTERYTRDYATAPDVLAENLGWLQKTVALCEERGVRLVLFQVPSCAYVPAAALERIRDAAGGGAEIVDFNERFDTMDIDMETDFYDFLHFNARGAVKFSRALAMYLAEAGIAPGTHDEALWQWRTSTFAERLAALDSGENKTYNQLYPGPAQG